MPEKILIVDDDVDSLKLIGLMLQRSGYEVSAASTGLQALAKAEAERPNLIILDVMMPDMNGLEVCRRLRANASTQDIPIIMFTAKTLIDDKVKGFEAGADDYLTKPTHPQELATRVRAMLTRASSKQEAPIQTQSVSRPRNISIGVLGAKGGVGATTVAVNLGAGMLVSGENPIVADFRLGSGGVGAMLGLIRTQSMSRLLTSQPTDLTQKAVENALASHASGLRALVCSVNAREAQLKFSEDQAVNIINHVRMLGKPAIFDLGSTYSGLTARLLQEMERILLVVEPNSLCINMARELLRQLDEDGSGNRVGLVVVSRAQSSLQTSWQEVEAALGREIRAIVSPAPELAFQALENKTPLILLQPNSVVAGQFAKLTEAMKPKLKSIAGGQLTT
ncbi:response regulator [Aggregatilineales bacterium SYSU G02658]